MGYYLCDADGEEHILLGPKDPAVWDFFLDQFDTANRFEGWTPFEVQPITEFVQDLNKIGDVINFNATPICIFTDKAKTQLAPLLDQSGEFLPVFGMGRTFYLYHVTTILNALDASKSIIDRFTSGRVMWVQRIILNEQAIGGHNTFRIPEIKWQIFASELLVNEVARLGLEGFVFKKL